MINSDVFVLVIYVLSVNKLFELFQMCLKRTGAQIALKLPQMFVLTVAIPFLFCKNHVFVC